MRFEKHTVSECLHTSMSDKHDSNLRTIFTSWELSTYPSELDAVSLNGSCDIDVVLTPAKFDSSISIALLASSKFDCPSFTLSTSYNLCLEVLFPELFSEQQNLFLSS